VFRSGDMSYAFVVKDGRAKRRQIELVRRAKRFAAVASGLTPGEIVIVYPSDKVTDGIRVTER
jgi:HlyD family secretion protein